MAHGFAWGTYPWAFEQVWPFTLFWSFFSQNNNQNYFIFSFFYKPGLQILGFWGTAPLPIPAPCTSMLDSLIFFSIRPNFLPILCLIIIQKQLSKCQFWCWGRNVSQCTYHYNLVNFKWHLGMQKDVGLSAADVQTCHRFYCTTFFFKKAQNLIEKSRSLEWHWNELFFFFFAFKFSPNEIL